VVAGFVGAVVAVVAWAFPAPEDTDTELVGAVVTWAVPNQGDADAALVGAVDADIAVVGDGGSYFAFKAEST
jgi:hypothetical protein